jgi:hypothetical protein
MSSDPFEARWARARRDELQGLALLLEASDPLEAQRVWRHAACLAPDDAEIALALERTARSVVHRPGVEARASLGVERRTTLGAAFALLDRAARVAPVERGETSAGFDFAPIDAQIDTAALRLDEARFAAALALSDLARARLARFAPEPPVSERRVRIELLAATARIALGEEQDARTCVERALREQPDLTLDPARFTPKLRRLLGETRTRLAERAR